MTRQVIRTVGKLGPAAYYRSEITREWLVEDRFGNVRDASSEVCALLDLYAPFAFKAEPLTKRQTRVLDVIVANFVGHGFMPSFRILATQLNVKSEASVFEIMQVLVLRGWMERTRHGHKSIYTPTAAALERHTQRSRVNQ